MSLVNFLKVATSYTLTRLENFSSARGGIFLFTAMTFVKVLKQRGLGLKGQVVVEIGTCSTRIG
jgi:hypothetical protein